MGKLRIVSTMKQSTKNSFYQLFKKYRVVILFPAITALAIGADLKHTLKFRQEKLDRPNDKAGLA